MKSNIKETGDSLGNLENRKSKEVSKLINIICINVYII